MAAQREQLGRCLTSHAGCKRGHRKRLEDSGKLECESEDEEMNISHMPCGCLQPGNRPFSVCTIKSRRKKPPVWSDIAGNREVNTFSVREKAHGTC